MRTIMILAWASWGAEVSLAVLVAAVAVAVVAAMADRAKRIAILPWVRWRADVSLAALMVPVAAAMVDSAKRIAIVPRVRWGAQASLAAALVVAVVVGTTAVTADDAKATPIYSVCYPGDEVGYYEWYDDGQGNFTDHIGINECALERLGAGPMDRQRVLDHELGHANGYGHSDYEGDLMAPYMVMWGV